MLEKKLRDIKIKDIVHNKKCLRKELDTQLEKCEQALIEAFYEENHGEILNLEHVIHHIQNLSKEKGLEDNKIIISMIEQIRLFYKYIKEIKKGSKGERFARKALNKLTIPSYILENVELKFDDVITECDFVVINKNGIFIIEVKFCDNDMCITNDGFLVPKYDTTVSLGTRNILDQLSNEKDVVLKHLVTKCGITDSFEFSKKIHSVVLFSNRNKRVYDESHSANVLYCHNVSNYISEYDANIGLSDYEIEKYYSILSENEINNEYMIDFDLDLLCDTFIKGLHLLEDKDNDETEKNNIYDIDLDTNLDKKWEFDIKSAFIGGLSASVLAFATNAIYHNKDEIYNYITDIFKRNRRY